MAEPSIDEMRAALKAQKPEPSIDEMRAALKTSPDQVSEAPQEERSPMSVTGRGLAQGALDALPTVGAMVGGVGGAAFGLATGPAAPVVAPLAGVAGAGAGAMAGQSLKSALETAIFGQGPKSRSEFYQGLAEKGKEGAIGQMTGEIIPPAIGGGIQEVGPAVTGLSKQATKTYMAAPEAVKALSQASNGDVALAADQIRTKYQGAIDQTKSELEKPVLEIMANKATTASNVQVGDAQKAALKNKITTEYAPFKKAYDTLDQINDVIPISDEASRGFREKLMDWARNEFPNRPQMYKKVEDIGQNLTASGNMAQFKGSMGDLKDLKNSAWNGQKHTEYGVLSDVHDMAEGFMKQQMDGLAKRISEGKGTPQEMQAFEKLMVAQQNPTVPVSEENLKIYAKSVTDDYLKSAKTVDQGYSAFKSMARDMNVQSKVKGESTVRFLQNLDQVPSEKLANNINQLFDKDTKSLAKMKEQSPEAFDIAAKYKVKDLVSDSQVNGKLDATKFHENVQALSPEARNLLFSGEEQKAIESTVNGDKLVRMNELLSSMDSKLYSKDTNHSALLAAGSGKNDRYVKDLVEMSRLTGTNMIRDAQLLHSMSEFANPAYVSRGGAGATVGGAAGAAIGYMSTGSHVGAEAGGAIGAAAGGALTSPRMLKGAIDLGQLAKPATSNPYVRNTLGQGVMHGTSALGQLRKP